VERQLHVKEELSESTAHSIIIKLSTGLNLLVHAGHVAQDVEWNIGCAKLVVVWHYHTAWIGWKNEREKPSKTYLII